jgi:hypothetical protein
VTSTSEYVHVYLLKSEMETSGIYQNNSGSQTFVNTLIFCKEDFHHFCTTIYLIVFYLYKNLIVMKLDPHVTACTKINPDGLTSST